MNRRIATAMTIAAALFAPAAATAAPLNDSYAVNIAAQSQNLGSYSVVDSHNFELAFVDYSLNVTSRATWTGTLSGVTSWNSANVRQGATLPVGRVSPLQSGALHVSWTVKGDIFATPVGRRDVDKTITVDASCAPVLLGTTYDCTAESPSLQLLRMSGAPNAPYMNLKLRAKFTITPEGAIVSRSLTTAGMDPVTKTGLALSPAPAIDNVNVPCAQAGSPVAYKFGTFHWTPGVAVSQQPYIQMGAMDPVLGQVELPAYSDKPYGPPIKSSPAFDLTASSHTSSLGTLLPNNVAPAIAPMSFSATAGVPEQLDADVSARCDVASYVWKFSDGTTAYGAAPLKTFSKPVSGQLKVTDSSGLSATRDFSVGVS